MTPDDQRLGAAPELMAIIQYGAMAQMVCVAAELRVMDVLATGPKNIRELVQVTNAHAPSLERLLRALKTLDLCDEQDAGTFVLRPMGSLLRTESPNSLRSWLIWFGRYHWPAWGKLLHTIRTGESARKFVTRSDGFVGFLERDQETAELFNDTMAQLTSLIAKDVAKRYEFAGMRRIVDVGGGRGELLANILGIHPMLQGMLLDLPHAIQSAAPFMKQAGLMDRCEILGGDFFNSIPSGADAYVVKDVIHDWDDEKAGTILNNCRGAMPGNQKLLIIERVMPARLVPCAAHRAIAYADMAMLVGPGGRQRTEVEYRDLLDASGFNLVRTIPIGFEYSIIEAEPRVAS